MMIVRTDGIVQIAEHKEEGDDQTQFEEGELDDSCLVNEVVEENLFHNGGHLEYLRSHVDAGKHRNHRYHRDDSHAHQVEQPSVYEEIALADEFGKVFLLHRHTVLADAHQFLRQHTLFIHRRQVIQTGDGLNGSQLVRPPNHNLDSQQGVANPRTDAADNHRSQ